MVIELDAGKIRALTGGIGVRFLMIMVTIRARLRRGGRRAPTSRHLDQGNPRRTQVLLA
jgi:hypothetical protein